MKILHVITRLILGGAQQNTVMSCAAQVAAGHEVHLAFGSIHGPEGSLLDEARASGATLHEVPTMVREVSPWNDDRCYRALRKLVRGLGPDVVHTHSSKAGILGRAAAWKEKASRSGRGVREDWGAVSGKLPGPVVVHTVHGLPFHDRQNAAVHGLYVALERFAAKRCDQLIAITPAMVDAFVEQRIAPRAKFAVIPSGVEIERFAIDLPRDEAKIKLGLDPALPVVGLVARLDPLKGHRDLLAALPAIARVVPGVQVLFVGDGFDRESVGQAVATSPHRDRVTMLNLVAFEQMPAVYRAMDVCVLPSYQEGQSRVLVEALAAGCGIAAYDVGGIPSVCVDGVTGLLVPVGDTEALAGAVVQLLRDPTARQQLTAQGQRHVREHFSAAAMNEALEALYQRRVGGPGL